jgi:hypothetical protein
VVVLLQLHLDVLAVAGLVIDTCVVTVGPSLRLIASCGGRDGRGV